MLSGLAGRDQLRGMLARLQEKKRYCCWAGVSRCPFPFARGAMTNGSMTRCGAGDRRCPEKRYTREEANRDLF